MAVRSKEVLFMQGIWKQALRAGDKGLLIEFKTKGGALRARMALYNAVREAKQKMSDDPELNRAAEEIEITFADAEHTSLHLRPKRISDMMQGLMAVAEVGMERVRDPEAEESLRRVREQLEGGDGAGPKKVKNPFYTER